MSASAAGASRSVRISRVGSPEARAARPSSRRDGPSGAAGSRAEPADAASARADRHAAGGLRRGRLPARRGARVRAGSPPRARGCRPRGGARRAPPRRWSRAAPGPRRPPAREGAARPRPERAAQAAIIASPPAAVNEMPARSTLRVGEPLDEAGDDAVGGRAVVRQRPAGDARVDHRGPARCERLRERVLELLQGLDGVAVGAACLGVGDVVGVLELDQAGLVVGRELVDLDQLELARRRRSPR